VASSDRYGVLLGLILLNLTLLAALAGTDLGGLAGVVLQGWILLFALRTSRAGLRARRIALALVILAAVVATGSLVTGATGQVVVSATSAALMLGTSVAIARRLGTHPVVSSRTVLGAVCIYLLVGMFYASVYALLAVAAGGPLFAQGFDGDMVDHLYFSYTTLTTVGFGDLAMATDVPRIVAVTEALIGQVYLVTVVAMVVSNLGRARRLPAGDGAAPGEASNTITRRR
jgi:hypothetical protein